MSPNRRYDVDWVRVIAIGLLLIYHVAIGFQAWAPMIGFIASKEPWPSLWVPMAMLNIWRIPLLFFVSGMGIYFALQNRNLKRLFLDRTLRILLPFVFGIFAIVPIHTYIWQYHHGLRLAYRPDAGHLWFLGNIFVYAIILSPAFWLLKRYEDGPVARFVKALFGSPAGIAFVLLSFIAEVILVHPVPYELYARTWHGFWLGLLAFFFGFCFVFSGQKFTTITVKWRWIFILPAAALFTYRVLSYQVTSPFYPVLLVIESQCWILSVFAFAYKYLNRDSKLLRYLSQAAYPVYILHMIFLYLGSTLLMRSGLPVAVQFVLILCFTLAGCLACYEWIITRIGPLRLLLGLKWKPRDKNTHGIHGQHVLARARREKH